MTDFYYRSSSDTLWIGTAEHPALARFGRRGYEIHCAPETGAAAIARQISDDPLADWRDFVTAMAAHGIKLTTAHAPETIRERLPPSEQAAPAKVEICDLIDQANPFEVDIWGVGPLSKAEVAAAVAGKNFVRTPFHAQTRLAHTRRVAYLAAHPETWAPISIECGPGAFDVIDGYHRIAAAIFTGRATIDADLSGFESVASALAAKAAA